MQIRLLALCLTVAALLSTTTRSQIRAGEFGFTASTPAATAGDSCWGFTCRPHQLSVRAGDTVQLGIRAPLGNPFVILASVGATQCQTIPGIHNSLVLDAPVLSLVAGVVSVRNTARFCYDGLDSVSFTVPRSIPAGFQLALQAAAIVPLASGRPSPTFASAIGMTVR